MDTKTVLAYADALANPDLTLTLSETDIGTHAVLVLNNKAHAELLHRFESYCVDPTCIRPHSWDDGDNF